MHPKLIYFSNDFASNINPYDSEFISCGQDVTFDSVGQQKLQIPGRFRMHINKRHCRSGGPLQNRPKHAISPATATYDCVRPG